MHSNQSGPAARPANGRTTSESPCEHSIGSAVVKASPCVPGPESTPSPLLLMRCSLFVVDWQLTELAPSPRRTLR